MLAAMRARHEHGTLTERIALTTWTSRLAGLALCMLVPFVGATACGGDDAGSGGEAAGGTAGEAGRANAGGEKTEVRATVSDVFGRPLKGVRLSVVGSDESAVSSAAGKAQLELTNDRTVTVKLELDGYTEQFKVLALRPDAQVATLDAQLLLREPSRIIPAIEAGGAAAGRHGVRVEFPPNAVVDASGDPVSGAIEV